MKKTTDLLVYELNRIKYGYLALIGIVIVMQVGEIILATQNYMNSFRYFQRHGLGDTVGFLAQRGPLTYSDISIQTLYIFSIFLPIICLILYTFGIWYRDWWGKNNLSYRLLSLPGSRMSIFFAKLLTILFMIAGLLALQLLLMVFGDELLRILMPAEFYQASSVIAVTSTNPILFVILPNSLIDFLVHYLIGTAALTTVFLFIVLELSFKWRGILISLFILVLGIGIISLFIWLNFSNLLFPTETLLLIIAGSVAVLLVAIGISRKLMQTKISV